MKMRRDPAIVRREGIISLDRLVRLALVVYLSPVILVVFAIGLVGALAAKIVKPAGKIAVEGVHSAHKSGRPVGLAGAASQVREIA